MTVVPATVHTPALLAAAVKTTGSPEPAVAATTYAGPPAIAAAGGTDVKTIVWSAGTSTGGSGAVGLGAGGAEAGAVVTGGAGVDGRTVVTRACAPACGGLGALARRTRLGGVRRRGRGSDLRCALGRACTRVELCIEQRVRRRSLRARQRCAERTVRADAEGTQRCAQPRIRRLRAVVVDAEQCALERDRNACVGVVAEAGQEMQAGRCEGRPQRAGDDGGARLRRRHDRSPNSA